MTRPGRKDLNRFVKRLFNFVAADAGRRRQQELPAGQFRDGLQDQPRAWFERRGTGSHTPSRSPLRDGLNHEQDRLSEEIASHLALATEQNILAGMAPGEARRHARLSFGPVEAVRESYYAERSLPLLETLLMDVRYALRVLRKSPAFTIVALVTLMLGIGANIVVFGVLNAVVLQPLPVSQPRNLYQLRHKPWMNGRLLTTSYPAFEDIRQRTTSFSQMAAMNGYSHGELRWGNAHRGVAGYEVTSNYFDMLGVEPALGRFFHQRDEHGPGSAPYVVLSDTLWRSAFHADPGVIGLTVELNKHPFTILGVATAEFHGTEKFRWPDYWLPMANEEQVEGEDYLHSRTWPLTVLGRLKPGVTPAQATEDLNGIAIVLARQYPATDKGQAMRLIRPGLYGDQADVIRGFLWSVTVLALLVLAAACANLASLFAARAADRSRELALRVALGSSRRRLVRQLLTEAMILSVAGGAAGLGTAYLLLAMLNRWRPDPGDHLAVTVDARVYLAGLALTLTSALLFGMIPARQAWQSSPLQMIKSGLAESPHLRRFALRDLLLGGQIAICTLLVTSSLVAVRGMVQALHAPIGIRPQGAMLAEMDLGQGLADAAPGQVAGNGERTLQQEKALLEAARGIPGVTAAGAVNSPPLSGGGAKGIPVYGPQTTEFTLDKAVLETRLYGVSPGYLEAAGTRLLGGRDVSWQDTTQTPYVAIVNEAFARRMWGEAPAVGQRFLLEGRQTEVVGVAEDGKYHDLAETPQPALYLPLSQSEESQVVLVVRSPRPPGELAVALRHTLGNLAPDASLTLESWTDALAGVLFPARAATLALGVMGLLAAMLAVTGIFGMAAYSVSQRLKELGIRMALGARRSQVMLAAVGRPMVLLGAGSALGLLAGALSTRLLSQIVYQANPRDPAVIGGAVLTMALIGMAAAAIPARRALAVDPSKLMREE